MSCLVLTEINRSVAETRCVNKWPRGKYVILSATPVGQACEWIWQWQM
jgi:hypothetical protein